MRRNSRMDTGRSSVLETKRSGMENQSTLLKDSGIPQLHRWYSDSRIQFTQSLQLPLLLSRGILGMLKGKETIHFNANASNTKVLFRIIHSVNQVELVWTIRLDKGKTSWKERISDQGCVDTSVKSQAVNLLVSSPRPASGSSLRENIQDFESLSETIRFTKVCEDAIFVHRVSAGLSHKTRLDEDDGFGQIIPSCREYTRSRVNPRSRVFAATLGGRIIGPVIEVQMEKILDTCELEVAIQHQMIQDGHFYVVISSGKSRIVDESHIPNTELRSSTELLSDLLKAQGSELCLEKSKTCIQEIGADTLSVFPCQACLFTQRTIPMTERKSKVILAKSSYGGAPPAAVSKMVTRLVRHYDQDERQPDAAIHGDAIKPVLLKAFAKQGARDFSDKEWLRLLHQGSSKTRFEYCEDSQKFLGVLPSNSRTLWWNNNWPWVDGAHCDFLQLEGVYFITGIVLSASNLSWRMDSF